MNSDMKKIDSDFTAVKSNINYIKTIFAQMKQEKYTH